MPVPSEFYRLCNGVNRSGTRDVPCRAICPSAHEYVLNRNSRNHGWEIGSASSPGKRFISRSRSPSPLAQASPLAHASASAAAQSARVVSKSSAREGVGNAGCQRTRSRAWCVESTRVSHHGYAETPGIPARNGFNGFLRDLPGDRAFLSPSPAGTGSRQLDASVEASGPHDFSVRKQQSPVKRAARVHRIPRPTFRDVAQRPS